MTTHKVLCIDPGITTGWAKVEGPFPGKAFWTLHKQGSVTLQKSVGKKEYSIAKFLAWLDKINWDDLDVLLVENFIMRNDFREGKWTPLETAKLIGAAQDRSYVHHVRCVIKEPSHRAIGAKLSGLKRRSDRDPNRHWIDAANHGVSYLHNLRGYGTGVSISE